MAIADKAEDRLGSLGGYTDDHQAREQLVADRQRDHGRIKMTESHPPFLRDRAKVVLVVIEQRRKIHRFDDKALGHRRGEYRGA